MKRILSVLLTLALSIGAACAGTTAIPITPGTGVTSPLTMATSGTTLYGVTALCDLNSNCVTINGGVLSFQGTGVAGTPLNSLLTVQGTAGMSPIVVITPQTINTSPVVNTPVTQITSPWTVVCTAGCSAAGGTVTSTNLVQLNGVTIVGGTLPVSAFISNATSLGPVPQYGANPVTPSNQPVGTLIITPTQVTVGSSTELAAPRTGVAGVGRVAVTVVNTGTTSLWIGNSGVTSLTGLFIPPIPGASVTLNTTAGIFGQSAGSSTVSVLETY